MKWLKRGIVWNTDGQQAWSRSHAMCPTPFRISESVIRVYVTTLDELGRGRGMYVDLAAQDPTKVLAASTKPILDLGEPGAFDDNGVVPLSVLRVPGGDVYMYYAGFEVCTQIRYRIFTGLAISRDNGETFARYQRAPVLDRSDAELHFRCGPFVKYEDDRFKIWYVAGNSWLELDGKPMPIYDVRYAESPDGINWPAKGSTVLPITQDDEHGFGRPWIVTRSENKQDMFYCVRRKSFASYRMGLAHSADGRTWTRCDEDMGIDVSDAPYETEAVMYAAVIDVDGKEYCFYNGNGFGRDGFALAELTA